MFIVTLSNCSPDDGITPDDPGCQNKTEHYYLTDKDKSYIPYTGFDTIKMRNQAGDTLYFIGQGKQPFTTSEFVLHNNPACGNNGVEKIYEGYSILFRDIESVEKIIKIDHYKLFLNDTSPNEKQFNHVTISYLNSSFYTTDFQISNTKAQSYFGSLSINMKEFQSTNKVFKLYTDTSSYLIINKADGILKFSINNSNEILSILKR